MQTVIFSREYRHRISDLREARYPPNVAIEVTNEVADAARKAGAVKEIFDGERSTQADGEGRDHQPEKRRPAARNRSKSID